MSDQKKQVKCGACGQLGHNKRTCPTGKEAKPEVKPEIKLEPQIVYALEFAEDNGDDVHRSTTLYASLDGLLNGLDKLIKGLCEDYDGGFDSDDEDEDEDPPSYVKELFYYSGSTNLTKVPTPTREYLESVLNAGPKRSHLNGTIIKIGRDLGGAPCFACEISVRRQTLNP